MHHVLLVNRTVLRLRNDESTVGYPNIHIIGFLIVFYSFCSCVCCQSNEYGKIYG